MKMGDLLRTHSENRTENLLRASEGNIRGQMRQCEWAIEAEDSNARS